MVTAANSVNAATTSASAVLGVDGLFNGGESFVF
jgi:hypothetical protein